MFILLKQIILIPYPLKLPNKTNHT